MNNKYLQILGISEAEMKHYIDMFRNENNDETDRFTFGTKVYERLSKTPENLNKLLEITQETYKYSHEYTKYGIWPRENVDLCCINLLCCDMNCRLYTDFMNGKLNVDFNQL